MPNINIKNINKKFTRVKLMQRTPFNPSFKTHFHRIFQKLWKIKY